MICPNCGKSPMTFAQSLFRLDPREVICQNCGNELVLARPWVRTFWIAMISALVLGAAYALLRHLINWDNFWLVLVTWLALAWVNGVVFWRYARYHSVPSAVPAGQSSVT